MKREEYEEAKRKNADWDKEVAADIKSWVKLFIFDSVLGKREYKVIFDAIAKRIESFVSLIDEKEIADKYRSELTEYAQEVYRWADERFGGISPLLLALSLGDMKTRTKAQIKYVEDHKGFIAKIEGPLDFRTVAPENVTRGHLLERNVQDYAYTQGTAAQTYFGDMQKAVKQAMADFEALEVKPKYYANVNPRNIAEMSVRFNEYKRQKRELINQGVELVLVPSHANCSKRCQPFQGRVYSLNGTSGFIDGRHYIPIEEVSDNMTYTSKNTGRTYPCGLFSYNCRHFMTPYQKGMNIERIPDDVIERRRELEMEQRKMERNIRSMREKAELYRILYKHSKDEQMRKIARGAELKARNLKAKYIAFSQENHIAYIPTRLQILAGENRYVRTVGKKDAFAKEALKMKLEQQKQNEA